MFSTNRLPIKNAKISATCSQITTSISFLNITSCAVTLTVAGMPVHLFLMPVSSVTVDGAYIGMNTTVQTVSSVSFNITRNTIEIARWKFSFDQFTPGGNEFPLIHRPPGMIQYMDDPGPGTWTYQVQFRRNTSNTTAVVNTIGLAGYEIGG